jgi:hypothetical protein
MTLHEIILPLLARSALRAEIEEMFLRKVIRTRLSGNGSHFSLSFGIKIFDCSVNTGASVIFIAFESHYCAGCQPRLQAVASPAVSYRA